MTTDETLWVIQQDRRRQAAAAARERLVSDARRPDAAGRTEPALPAVPAEPRVLRPAEGAQGR
jgi:hypothetical protein